MKGLILSGGKGTRLRPITHTQAKQLVPVANKPVLFYGIEAIRDAGIKDIGIIVGDTKKEIMDAVGDGSKWDVKVTYIEQESPLGIAHAVLIAEEFINRSPFVVYLGDNLIKYGIKDFVNEFLSHKPNAQVLLAEVPNPHQFGVAELSEGRVINLEEKPKKPKSNLALVGVYMFDHTIFEAVKNIKPSRRKELEITDSIQYLIDNGFNVQSHIINGWWKDTGKLEDMLEANRIILDTLKTDIKGEVDKDSHIDFKVVLEEGSSVTHSIIRGPAIIGAGSKIINSYVGPFTSIGKDVIIENTEVEHSIVLESSSILNVKIRIADSLIGKNVKVSKLPHKPEVYRLMLGDYSEIGLI
ncbi:MAG TPA: glucose-1-phosphate thymidylyltransferase [Nitrospinota bacterium]|nr:glucose-1-phosphate thymidylyltransferase [Nitrospinota bacterium]